MRVMSFLFAAALAAVSLGSVEAVVPNDKQQFKQLRAETETSHNNLRHVEATEVEMDLAKPLPTTVTTQFIQGLDTENFRLTKRLGGGSFGEAFRCHIKKSSRPSAGMFSKVDKEHFAVKFVSNSGDELSSRNLYEAKVGAFVHKHMMCSGETRCKCFASANPQYGYWHEPNTKKAWFSKVQASLSYRGFSQIYGGDNGEGGNSMVILMQLADGTLRGAIEDKADWLTDAAKLSVLFQLSFAINAFHTWDSSHGDAHLGNVFALDVPKDPCTKDQTAAPTCDYYCFEFGTGFDKKAPTKACVPASDTSNKLIRVGDFGSWRQSVARTGLEVGGEGAGSCTDAAAVDSACEELFSKTDEKCVNLAKITKGRGSNKATSSIFSAYPKEPPTGKTGCWFSANQDATPVVEE